KKPVTTVQLAPYPVAAPLPVGDSRLPALVDDDELVRARIDANGTIHGLVDEIRLKIGGSGDFNLILPGIVKAVSDLGGDSSPSLAQGHVVFQSFLAGAQRTLGAEAVLDPVTSSGVVPVAEHLTYTRSGLSITPPAAAGKAGTFGEDVEID